MTARISVDRIKRAVADEFDISLHDLVCARREREFVRPRQVAIAIAMNLTSNSTVVLGRLFGGRDHTTVLASRHRVEKLRGADSIFDRRCRRLEAALLEPVDAPRPEHQLTFLDGPLFDRPFARSAAAS